MSKTPLHRAGASATPREGLIIFGLALLLRVAVSYYNMRDGRR